MTELKNAEEKIAELEYKLNSIQSLIDIVAHDIRSPLTLIGSCIEVIEMIDSDKKTLDETTKNFLKRIEESQRKAAKLVTDILDMGRTDSGLKYAPKYHEIFPLADKIVADIKHSLSGNERSFIVDVPSDTKAFCDNDRLTQVLDNLIGNAIKATKIGTMITIKGWHDFHKDLGVNGCFISVTDEGIGIPAKKLKSIFEKYQQLDSAAKHLGVGLGLTIVRKFVQMHRGEVSVSSVEGEGTTFTVFFPDQKETNTSNERKDVTKLKVLIVDDDEDIRELYVDGLADLPVYIFEAENGFEALEVCQAQQVDVIFSDVQMPKMDGIEFLQEFSKLGGNGDFYLLSGANDNLRVDMLNKNLKVKDFLLKPISVDDLIVIVNKKIENS